MAPNDKRASPRFSAKSGSHVIYIEGSGAIADLSLNGVFVLDPDPLPVGTHIHLDFVLEPTASSLKGLSGVPLLKKGWGFNSRNFLARGEGSKYTLPIQLPGPAKQRTLDHS
jgi:hypothetical protein